MSFPMTFFWSNRQHEDIFKHFFLSIKNRLPNLQIRTFMSNNYTELYNAWKSVFGETEYHLICNWHVKR